jgi:hypothetical protein
MEFSESILLHGISLFCYIIYYKEYSINRCIAVTICSSYRMSFKVEKCINGLSNLTFRGPCIVIYSYNKSQRDALFHKFILVKNTTCFGYFQHDKYLLIFEVHLSVHRSDK